jgi:hypothetical protein
MDSAAMIDEVTFEQVVRRKVGGVLDAYGFEPTSASGFRVRFEKPATYVEVIYDASRSHEVSIWRGESSDDREPPLELADVLRATDCSAEDIEFAELIQTSDADGRSRLLERASRLLRQCAGLFLTDGRSAFAAARALRSARAAAYTTEVRNRGVLDAADAAWKKKDYGRVHDLLDPIRDSLGEPHRRRLDFAEKKL